MVRSLENFRRMTKRTTRPFGVVFNGRTFAISRTHVSDRLEPQY